jgi:hypothetical protein
MSAFLQLYSGQKEIVIGFVVSFFQTNAHPGSGASEQLRPG